MIERRTFLASAALFTSALSLGGCGDDRFPDYHYKMTIHVGDRAFSSVRGVEQERVTSIADSGGQTIKRRLSGEAVIIEANGRTYYALLSKPDNADYALLTVTQASLGVAMAAMPDPDAPKSEQQKAIAEWRRDQPGRDPNAYLDDIASESRVMTELKGVYPLQRTLPARQGRPPLDAWPMFVTFGDPNDPKTVREVSPESIGVSNITVEITDEPVTIGIEERFPWWSQYKRLRFDGTSRVTQNMTTTDMRNSLTTGDFSTGEVK